MTITIKTNHQPRPLLSGWDLTPAERAQLDYVDWAAVEVGDDSWSGFRYRGELYDLSDFEARTRPADGSVQDLPDYWHGHRADSYFSAVLVHLDTYGEFVVVGYAHW